MPSLTEGWTIGNEAPMKLILLTLAAFLTAASTLVAGGPGSGRRCKGEDPCPVCKDCSRCAYCVSGKGSCGTCRDQNGEQSRTRNEKREKLANDGRGAGPKR